MIILIILFSCSLYRSKPTFVFTLKDLESKQTPFLLTLSENVIFDSMYAKDSNGFDDILSKRDFFELFMDYERGSYTLQVRFRKNSDKDVKQFKVNLPIEGEVAVRTHDVLADKTAQCLNAESLTPPLSGMFTVPDKISPILDLPIVIDEEGGKENVLKEVENLPGPSTSGKSKMGKGTSKVQKRMMYRMADMNFVLGRDMDTFFTLDEPEIIEKVKFMNHSTRTYLAVKIVRQSPLDFEEKYKSKFSLNKVYELLNVSNSSIRKIVGLIEENQSLKDFMQKK